MTGFPSTAELRERAALDAAEAMRPAAPLFVAAALSLIVAAGVLLFIALEHAERCFQMVGRV